MFRVSKAILVSVAVTVLSWVAVGTRSAVLAPAVPAVMLAAVRWLPAVRGSENRWMFLSVLCASLPFNLAVIRLPAVWEVLFDGMYVLGVLRVVVLYAVLLSAEQLCMGMAAMLLRKK